MKLRTRLALQFTTIVGTLMIVISIITYFLFSNYREETFFNRLQAKSFNTTKRLIADSGFDLSMVYTLTRQTSIPYVCEKIYTVNDSLIFNTDDNYVLHIDSALLNKIKAEKQVQFRFGEYEAIGHVYSENNKQLISIIAAIDDNGNSKLAYLFKLQLFGFVFGIGVVFLSCWVFVRRTLQPIYQVINEVGNITSGKLSVRISESNNGDEIDQFSKTFNNLLERMESAFEVQKNFIANASHEIRNPLAAITGQMEVALMRERTNQAYQQTITSVLDDMKKLNQLFNNLLLMAKTSHFDKSSFTELVLLDEVITEARAEALKHYPDFIIEIIINDKIEDASQLQIAGNKNLLTVAFTNLIDNGCKYSNRKTVTVELAVSDKQEILIAVKNRGIRITDDELVSIFNPFFRGENAAGTPGFGIGLSLIRNIVLMHHGHISVTSDPDGVTVFSLSFLPNKKFNQILIPS